MRLTAPLGDESRASGMKSIRNSSIRQSAIRSSANPSTRNLTSYPGIEAILWPVNRKEYEYDTAIE